MCFTDFHLESSQRGHSSKWFHDKVPVQTGWDMGQIKAVCCARMVLSAGVGIMALGNLNHSGCSTHSLGIFNHSAVIPPVLSTWSHPSPHLHPHPHPDLHHNLHPHPHPQPHLGEVTGARPSSHPSAAGRGKPRTARNSHDISCPFKACLKKTNFLCPFSSRIQSSQRCPFPHLP